MSTSQSLFAAVFIGVGATALLDLWLVVLKRLGVPTGSFALIGRWVAHLARGRLVHASISRAEPVRNESIIGWTTHYAVGIAFAAILVSLQGPGWVRHPSFVPAFVTGVATVALPLFVMQPAMGLGFAAAKTPTPLKNSARSVANHAVFGSGMYLVAIATSGLFQ